MTRSSRYALPVAERCAGTISAGQRWYGWGHKFTVNAETARTNRGVDAPTVGNPEPFCTSTPPKPLSPKEVVGVAIVPTPIIACLRFPRIAVSSVTLTEPLPAETISPAPAKRCSGICEDDTECQRPAVTEVTVRCPRCLDVSDEPICGVHLDELIFGEACCNDCYESGGGIVMLHIYGGDI